MIVVVVFVASSLSASFAVFDNEVVAVVAYSFLSTKPHVHKSHKFKFQQKRKESSLTSNMLFRQLSLALGALLLHPNATVAALPAATDMTTSSSSSLMMILLRIPNPFAATIDFAAI